jgi:hypothetical protein
MPVEGSMTPDAYAAVEAEELAADEKRATAVLNKKNKPPKTTFGKIRKSRVKKAGAGKAEAKKSRVKEVVAPLSVGEGGSSKQPIEKEAVVKKPHKKMSFADKKKSEKEQKRKREEKKSKTDLERIVRPSPKKARTGDDGW